MSNILLLTPCYLYLWVEFIARHVGDELCVGSEHIIVESSERQGEKLINVNGLEK